MTSEEVLQYCLTKPNSYTDQPFHDDTLCVKLNKKIFAQLFILGGENKVTLKCNPESADFYRQMFPDLVKRGYHCPPVQQPFWNTMPVIEIPDDEMMNMIDHAYEQVLKSFSKKVQLELQMLYEDSD